ncbi:hypothetical protein IB273_15890 [Pseudomonas sp. PDM19]|nr:hypothetical protein [Pseudomonas sp. PDM19]
MKSKDWLLIARRYNGVDQNAYDEKIKRAHDALKKNRQYITNYFSCGKLFSICCRLPPSKL